MILCVRTDTKDAEIYLQNAHEVLLQKTWQADRQLAKDLLREIESLLEQAAISWGDITGIAVYKGPGSFTGLRIGCTVANAAAYAQTIAIVGGSGDDWKRNAIDRLTQGENEAFVMPEYGAEPRITTPRK